MEYNFRRTSQDKSGLFILIMKNQAKTNVPQTMLAAEGHNNLFGRTKNPVVSHLTAGGSSSGEGSVLAFRGSGLGIGTDVGGSIRIPAAANGVYGYKPSVGILPFWGYAASSWTGMNTGVPAVCGPLAHSARDLGLFTRVIRATQPWLLDPAVLPHVFATTTTTSRKPVVGVLTTSSLTPHPPIRRALAEAATKLQQAGFSVRPFASIDLGAMRALTRQLFTVDGLSYQKRELAKVGEPPVPSVRNIGFWDLAPKRHEAMWSLNTQKAALQKDMLARWTAAGVDVVLCPAGPHTALSPDGWVYDTYTVCWNALDVRPCSLSRPLFSSLVSMDNHQETNVLKYHDTYVVPGGDYTVHARGRCRGCARRQV